METEIFGNFLVSWRDVYFFLDVCLDLPVVLR